MDSSRKSCPAKCFKSLGSVLSEVSLTSYLKAQRMSHKPPHASHSSCANKLAETTNKPPTTYISPFNFQGQCQPRPVRQQYGGFSFMCRSKVSYCPQESYTLHRLLHGNLFVPITHHKGSLGETKKESHTTDGCRLRVSERWSTASTV